MSRPVSVVVPAFNGARTIRACLTAILAQLPPRSEVIVVDDGSTDDTRRIVGALDGSNPIRIVNGRSRGAAAALNDGVLAARHEIVCQIDQDVIIHAGWFGQILGGFTDDHVAAVQGRYSDSGSSRLIARAAALDLSERYARIPGAGLNHVCTGNTAYRVDALRDIGLFEETLGYGYDNDASYRLAEAGYGLRFCREATATHAWRETLRGYLSQQFGVGYGRLDVIARHPRRVAGDDVSGVGMISHAAITFLALAIVLVAPGASAVLLGGLAAERLIAGVRCWRRFADPAALIFPWLHLLRDAAWAVAIARWAGRSLLRRTMSPHVSMRRPGGVRRPIAFDRTSLGRVAAVIPALNERSSLPTVVSDLRSSWPELHVIVVDDGSEDGTFDAAVALGCDALRLPISLGVGSAVRTGICHARRLGYDTIVRLDADGQHAAADLPLLLAPVLSGAADAAVGTRVTSESGQWARRVGRYALSVALVPFVGRRIDDPTSGFWAFGGRASKLLAIRHPTGYPEPELHLLLARAKLTTAQVPVATRTRVAGRTSLTPRRAGLAFARTLLAMIVVPLRPSGEPPQ